MSIVAMKRKSRGFNAPISGHGKDGFSLNGGYRNQGWIGQTSISRPTHKTLFKGTEPVGHGGHLGDYVVSILPGSCSLNDSSVIKPSTLNTKGYIESNMVCCQETVKSIDPLQSSQEIYIKNLSDKMAACSNVKTSFATSYVCSDPAFASHFIGGKKKVVLPYAKTVSSLTSGEYISSMLLKKSCISTNAN